jgi:hypothetical protein
MVHRPRQSLRRLARRPRPSRKRRRWPLALAAALAVSVWWLWPADETPPVPPAAVPIAQAKDVAPRAAKAEPRKRAPPAAPKNELPEREALLAAVRERSATLKPCVIPQGTLTRLPLRLHVGKSGAMKALDFSGDPPSNIASCVRKTAMKWNFDNVKLSSDVDLLVSVSFQPTL